MNIFLIGYRCTGKTTAAKALSESLLWPFIDADAEVVRENGVSITEMVAQHGWDFFREKERAVIRRLSILDNHVIATGGGAVLDPENVKDMKKNGVIVWLKASPETIQKRILNDSQTKGQRPALTDKGLVDEIKDTLAFRNPLYENAADFSIDTALIDEIIEIIKQRVL